MQKLSLYILGTALIVSTAMILTTEVSYESEVISSSQAGRVNEITKSSIITKDGEFTVSLVDSVDIAEGGTLAEGMFADSSSSLKELKNNSDLIVHGTIVSQEKPNNMVVISTVQVIEQWKGKESYKEVIIHQLNKQVLEMGEEYYLFLGKQMDENNNSFYIKGGHQGRFSVLNGNLINEHNPLFQEELKKELAALEKLKLDTNDSNKPEQTALLEHWLDQ
ncbi:hypothetical protein [Paenibacillus tarimensis]|uniref:hypothetical protein n=1 Tax=Paenibacillus tarimensis TaxID=416012 RepID=UPI001F1BC214|nr:hypothetical protein [Paenibacillus tarimensis]MCF2943841.1 hypothetical protein [Paenibacillus tarimensis]